MHFDNGQSCLLGDIFTFERPGGLPVVAPFEDLKETTCLCLTWCGVWDTVVAVFLVRCSLAASHIIGL